MPPLFIGYPQLVRGYDIGSFDDERVPGHASSSCPAFDRLLGSRMLVGNVELRFPLLRPFGVRQNMYGPLPIEVALFGDGGVAWTSDETPTAASEAAASRSRAPASRSASICLASRWGSLTSRGRCSGHGRGGCSNSA